VNLAHRVHWVDDMATASKHLPQLALGGIATHSVVEGDPSFDVRPVNSARRSRERATVSQYAPGRIAVDVECAAPTLLIVIENYSRGWEATVDGQPAPVWPANLCMMAVPVTEGRHEVVLTFRSAPFTKGCVLAALSLAAIAAGGAWSRSRRRSSNPHVSAALN
jgi:hypothetical protein